VIAQGEARSAEPWENVPQKFSALKGRNLRTQKKFGFGSGLTGREIYWPRYPDLRSPTRCCLGYHIKGFQPGGQVVSSRYTGKTARFKVRIPPHLLEEFSAFVVVEK
jgi:hypothetical protein